MKLNMPVISVIGAGFSGLSAAAYLAKAGHEVHVFEKNNNAGGRARQLTTDNGYVFDMGPSWYWMPDVFERFFNDFGYRVSDFYNLKLLDPSFEIVFGNQKTISVPSNINALAEIFDSIENNSSKRLKEFLSQAEVKYRISMEKFVYKPSLSIAEFLSIEIVRSVFKMDLFSSLSRHVRRYFSNEMLIALMEFPVLFLGGMPQNTPAMYSMMNHAGLQLGTWYPVGGFGKVIDGMKKLAEENGAVFHFDTPVRKIQTQNNQAKAIISDSSEFQCDAVVAAADYHHVEDQLIEEPQKNYRKEYWDKKTFAPSCLIYYLGINKKINRLNHHTLFFDEDLTQHAKEIYRQPKWPSKPLFYVCCPSKSDESVAPAGHENIFLLMPIAIGLSDDESTREQYFQSMMQRLEAFAGESILPHIDYKRSYCIRDFISDYNAFGGNAYGLANTLTQTAFFKPSVKNKKIRNLFYAGQLTVPGPGVPPAIISGKIAADQLTKYLKSKNNEITV